MKNIDFLPPKDFVAKGERHSQFWRVGVLVLFGGVICVAFIGQHRIRHNLEADLNLATQQHDLVQAQSTRLVRQQELLSSRRTEADLWTFLRHPWPRSQVLHALRTPLADTVFLRRVRILREQIPRVATNVTPPAPASSTAAAVALSPVQQDLQRLRDEAEATQFVVTIDATSASDADVHRYLAKLAAVPLFTKTDLTSIERSLQKSTTAVNFSVRLVLRPAYGLSGGPPLQTEPPVVNEQLARTTQEAPREAQP